MRRMLLVPALLALVVAQGVDAHDKEVEGVETGGAEAQAESHCTDGSAEGFPCWNVGLPAWLPPGVFGQGLGNDIWGWTDPGSGREYALMALQRGTAFVEISDPDDPVYLGFLPTRSVASICGRSPARRTAGYPGSTRSTAAPRTCR